MILKNQFTVAVIVELCRYLLAMFTSNQLEKNYGKISQGSGGTYFISVY